ncbi:MAG: hypothetical protein ACT4PP_00565 [Sporichthyaceae bacterium]
MLRAADVARGEHATFSIDVTGSDPEDGFTAEGAIRVGTPPALRISSTGTNPDPSQKPGRNDFVVIGGTIYGRLIGADDGGLATRFPWLGLVPDWESVPVDSPDDDRGFDIGGFLLTFGGKDDLDPREYAFAAAAGADLQPEGGEEIDGAATTRYVGELEADRVRGAPVMDPDLREMLLNEVAGGNAVRAQFWVDGEDHLRRFVLSDSERTLRMQFRDLGRDPQITAPPPQDLRPLPMLGTEDGDALLRGRLEFRYGPECGGPSRAVPPWAGAAEGGHSPSVHILTSDQPSSGVTGMHTG